MRFIRGIASRCGVRGKSACHFGQVKAGCSLMVHAEGTVGLQSHAARDLIGCAAESMLPSSLAIALNFVNRQTLRMAPNSEMQISKSSAILLQIAKDSPINC